MSASEDLTAVGALIGERARANMLAALMSGDALTATELARAAGITKQTASSHLNKLCAGRLVAAERAGRHRYFRLADPDVARTLEALLDVGMRVRAPRPAPAADPAMQKARVCYDHLAGALGVLVYDSLVERDLLRVDRGALVVTSRAHRFLAELGIDLDLLAERRRPLCLACLDWTARRHHLAGALGAAILERCLTLGWARRSRTSRVLHFSALGEHALRQRFPVRPR
jgi:DNA-binding transcriptional ArsR family regulator